MVTREVIEPKIWNILSMECEQKAGMDSEENLNL